MSFQTDYEKAVRTQFVDVRRDKYGKEVYTLLPFQLVNIGGQTYIETMYEPVHVSLNGGIGSPFKFNHLQVCDYSDAKTYNPSVPPTFMKQVGL